MKIRQGFVSNSSSSSFTCSVCEGEFSGWDATPSEFNHRTCINGHIFCGDKIVNKEKFDRLVEKGEEVDYDKLPQRYWEEPNYIEKYGIIGDDFYVVPAEFCPCCQRTIIPRSECIQYLLKKYNLTHEDIAKEVKEKFPTYGEFLEYLKG